jgi:hypothetical protein
MSKRSNRKIYKRKSSKKCSKKCKSTKSRSNKRQSRRRTRQSRRRSFGSKDSLSNMMGNFRPPAEMSFAQSTTGMAPSQMANHMGDIPPSLRDNFYIHA